MASNPAWAANSTSSREGKVNPNTLAFLPSLFFLAKPALIIISSEIPCFFNSSLKAFQEFSE